MLVYQRVSMFPRLLVDLPFQLKIVREHFEGTSGKPLMALGWGRNFNPPSICHWKTNSPRYRTHYEHLRLGHFTCEHMTWNLCHRCTGASTLDAQIWSIESNSVHDDSMGAMNTSLQCGDAVLCDAVTHITSYYCIYSVGFCRYNYL